MKADEEIREIFGHLKNLIIAHQEMGLEPPPLSNEVRDYLETPLSKKQARSRPTADPGSLEELKAFIGDCRRCKLHKGRAHLVFGEGLPQARLVFVGEGPGRDEDMSGRPFVGAAGGLLTSIIEKGMGLNREEVYILNIVKCRPPGNRDPQMDEIEACIPFLKQQLKIIRPEVICVLGRIAGQALLGGDFKITVERGKWRSYMDIPLMPTYHPAYIIRNPARERQLKGLVWEDIKKVMARLGLEVKK